MPSGLIDEEGRHRFLRDRLGDFGQMQVHRLGVTGGRIGAAPFPCFGQKAPKMLVEAVR
jgi:hypothetical protein